jgi:hypothetical protein
MALVTADGQKAYPKCRERGIVIPAFEVKRLPLE